jgi:hypothetical protein
MARLIGEALPRRDRSAILRVGVGDSDMAKKRIASADLGWIILEQLKEEKEFPIGMSLAIIPDEVSGWRTIINAGGRRRMRPSVERRLAAIENELRGVYKLDI